MPTDSVAIRIALIAAAGALGALARWGTNSAVHAVFGRNEPWNWATVAVNLGGCFLFGVMCIYLHPKSVTALTVLTGFLGAYTTFSAFAFDTHVLILERGLLAATLNVAIHVGGGLVALVAGMALGRTLL
jgi:CrcB protein